ncbi:hypothetical protein QUF76_13525 [Desulfobacterales bacterium HSG16]|nr:hypothetical protein [Desulfobacterales bacterium HSG16]
MVKKRTNFCGVMKWSVFIVFLLVCVPLLGHDVWAGEGGYTPDMRAEDDAVLEKLSLSRICFVRKGPAGNEDVFIRIPPGMYRFVKARSKLKRGKRIVRILLRPRHHAALGKIFGKNPRKVMLRLSAKRMTTVNGLKGHYAVRHKNSF